MFGNLAVDVYTTGNLQVDGNTNLQSVNASSISSNTIVVDSLTVSSNGLTIQESFTPANSSIMEAAAGKIFYDSNYLYVATATGVIKRIPLGDF